MINEKEILEVEYDASSIGALEGLDAVRRRPGMYIGSTSQKGVTHLIFEAIDNSIDEFMAGYGDVVKVHVAKDGRVTVTDHGRGVPVGIHPTIKDAAGNPMDALTIAFTKLHAGSKFGGGGYKVSGGLHGVGMKAVNALSDDFVVTVRRNDNIYRQAFSIGEPLTGVEVVGKYDDGVTGTEVTYHPDSSIFRMTIMPDCKALQARFEELAALNAGVRIHYVNDETGVDREFHTPEGLSIYPQKLVADRTTLYDTPIHFMGEVPVHNGVIKVEGAFVHVDQEKPYELIKSFANNINTHEGGFHFQGFRRGYDDALSKFIADKGLSKEKVELNYVLDGIVGAISVKVPEAEFEGQTKEKLGNEEAKEAVEEVMKVELAKLMKDKQFEKIFEAIAQHAIRVKEAEEAARKARALARQGNKVKKMALPGKLSDCASKSGYTELFLVEGDSAGGAAKMGRNREFQAILALRGKVLNVERTDIERLLKSEAITNIIAALGTGVGKQFDIKKCRYDKVVIMADSDTDGQHIRMLLLTLFYKHMRGLIEAGLVYIAQAPLYKVVHNKKVYYMADEHEWKEFEKKHGKSAVNGRQRFKGLGEMNANQLWATTMNPETRTLIQVTIDNAEQAASTFEMLMGKDVEARRDFIEANAYRVELDFSI